MLLSLPMLVAIAERESVAAAVHRMMLVRYSSQSGNSLGIPTLAAMLGDMYVEYVFCPRKGTKSQEGDEES